MTNYGIELEFFIIKDGVPVPAYLHTNNLDGCQMIGEIKSIVSPDIVSVIFDTKKKLYQERVKLNANGLDLALISQATFTDQDLKERRRNQGKEFKQLDEKSIYFGRTGKLLPRKLFKASLPLNISDNKTKFITSSRLSNGVLTDRSYHIEYSETFDYFSIIRKLDLKFKKEIKESNRIPGVYAIKTGEKGLRIEYRSLPNNVDLEDLIRAVKNTTV